VNKVLRRIGSLNCPGYMNEVRNLHGWEFMYIQHRAGPHPAYRERGLKSSRFKSKLKRVAVERKFEGSTSIASLRSRGLDRARNSLEPTQNSDIATFENPWQWRMLGPGHVVQTFT